MPMAIVADGICCGPGDDIMIQISVCITGRKNI